MTKEEINKKLLEIQQKIHDLQSEFNRLLGRLEQINEEEKVKNNIVIGK